MPGSGADSIAFAARFSTKPHRVNVPISLTLQKAPDDKQEATPAENETKGEEEDEGCESDGEVAESEGQEDDEDEEEEVSSDPDIEEELTASQSQEGAGGGGVKANVNCYSKCYTDLLTSCTFPSCIFFFLHCFLPCRYLIDVLYVAQRVMGLCLRRLWV